MELIFLLISFCCVVATTITARKLVGGQFVLSPGNVYLILYIIFHFPLLFMIENSFVSYAIAINLGLFGFLSGMYLANRRVNPIDFRKKVLSRRIQRSPDANAVVLLCFGVLVSLLFYKGLPPSFAIFFDALSGKNVFDQLLRMSDVRAELTKSHYFGGGYAGQGALKLVNEIVWQVLAVFMYIRAIATGKWSQFFMVVLLSALIIYGGGAKGPVVFIAVAILVARTFITNISTMRVVKYAVVLLLFMVIIQSLQVSRLSTAAGGGFFVSILDALSRRLAAGNGLNTYHLVDLIETGVLQHQFGREHLVKFLNAIPGVQFATPYAHELFWLISEDKSVDKTTYASYTYLGGAYLDFGIAGAFFISAIAGFVLQAFFLLMHKLPWTTFNISFSAVLTIQLGQMVAGSLVSLPATLVAAGIVYAVVVSSNIFLGGSSRRQARM